MYCLTNLLVFDISLLYYNFNLTSLIVCWLYSGNIYLSVGIFRTNVVLSLSILSVSEFLYDKLFDTFVIVSAILLPMQSLVTSTVFWIVLFEVVLSASVADCLAWLRCFWLYVLINFLR